MNFDEWDRITGGEGRTGPGGPPVPPPAPPPGYGQVIPQPDGAPPEAPPDLGTFEPPAYTGSSRPSFGFQPPPRFNPTMFSAPSQEDALNEAGYQFRSSEGQKGLERSAAARGLLRTGGTLKDLAAWNQNFASEEYSNVFNRALQAYGAQYQAERDMFAPQFADWQARFGAEQAAGLAGFEGEWQRYNAMLQALMQREQMGLMAAGMNQPAAPQVRY